ncbi:MAG: hypothetical protein HY866_11145 [Chloroflexi bacterium]|nr:hypothetical protein [Chloroflexota bacterium]
MKLVRDQEFQGYHDDADRRIIRGRVFSHLEFEHCLFVGCFLSVCKYPRQRSIWRHIRWIDCQAHACTVYAAILDEVEVRHLKVTYSPLFMRDTVFRHVTFTGKIGRIVILRDHNRTGRQRRRFDRAIQTFYQSVDWAIDISQAEFFECDIRSSIPAHLIRRDPETQVVIKREKALLGAWKDIDLSATFWPLVIEMFLESQAPDVVLVAPKANADFRKLLKGLQLLREAGVAEPD